MGRKETVFKYFNEQKEYTDDRVALGIEKNSLQIKSQQCNEKFLRVIVDEISSTTNRPPLSAGLKGCGILYSGRDIRYSFTLP